MKAVKIECQKRENLGKAANKKLRQQGMVPGEVYGSEGNIHFYADERAFKDLIYNPAFTKAEVVVDGKSYEAVIKELQFHPVTDKLLHVDLLMLEKGKPIIVDIPIKLEGRAKGVVGGGRLIQKVRKLRVKCLPEHLREYIKVDVTHLELHQSYKVGDLNEEKATLELLNSPSIPVCTVTTTRALRSAATQAAKDAKKGGEAEGEEAAAEEAAAEE